MTHTRMRGRIRTSLMYLGATTALLVAGSSASHAQLMYQRAYGTSYSESMTEPSGRIRNGHQARMTRDGGLIMGGRADVNRSSPYLVRANANGSLAWSRLYALPNEAVIADVQQTTDGGYVMVGTYHWDIIVGPGGLPNTDMFVMKTDEKGNPSWAYGLGTTAYFEHAIAVEQTADGGYMVCGNHADDGDAYLIKLSASGTLEWSKYYFWIKARGLLRTADGGYAVCGYSNDVSPTTRDAALLKVDDRGKVEWMWGYGNANADEEACSVRQNADGGYILVGYRGKNIYAVRTDGSGAPTWQNSYGSDEGNIARDVKILQSGDYIVAGEYAGTRACLMKLSPSGACTWTKAYGKSGKDSRFFYVGVYGNGFVGIGETDGIGSGNYDYYAVRTDPNGSVDCQTDPVSWTAQEVTGSLQKDPSFYTGCDQYSMRVTMSSPATALFTSCFSTMGLNASDLTMNDIRIDRSYTVDPTGGGGGWVDDAKFVAEPCPVGGPMWSSEAIWNRIEQDAVVTTRAAGSLYEHEKENQSPRYNGSSNYLYVAVENHGSMASGPATLNVYWSKSSTAPVWSANWLGYTVGATTYGDLLGSQALPSIPPGDVYVAEIPWTPADPADFGEQSSTYSYLARIVSAGDPMAFPETDGTETNALNNNNIAWRNEIIVTSSDMTPLNLSGIKHLMVRNTTASPATVTLRFGIPAEEQGLNPLFGGGDLVVDLGATLYTAWQTGGAMGTGITDNGNGTVTVTSDGATLENITLLANQEETMGLRFEYSGAALDQPAYYHYDVVQDGAGGAGATFELNFPVTAPAPKRDVPATRFAPELAGASLDALPNPSSGGTLINYQLPADGIASLAVYDITGREVLTLLPPTSLAAGSHGIIWDGNDAAGRAVPSGLYLIRLKTAQGIVNHQARIVR